jgi:glycosyltransferase involved in cell wall biosynthesis
MHRVLFVGRTRYSEPLSLTHERKFAALGKVLDVRVLGSAVRRGPAPSGFRLLPPVPVRPLDGALFYVRLPFAVAKEIRSFRPDAIVAQSPYEGLAALAGRALARSRTEVIVEIHGDWRTATRLYGSQARGLLSPATDRLAALAIRRADGVRAVSEFTADLARSVGVSPTATFHAYIELDSFLAEPIAPLPPTPHLVFVGVLERYKNIEGLADAWRRAAPQLPGVAFDLVGNGSRVDVVERLVADLPDQTVWHSRLEPTEIAALLDRSWALVLPSFSEGLPRVAIESLARGRPVVGSDAGGIPNAVRDGENGLLVPPGDSTALADALVRLCSDRALAERLAANARPSGEHLLTTPDEYARRVADLVEQVVAA